MSAMEPGGADGRQADVIPASSHDSHEPLDIAAFAAGDLEGPDRDRVRRLVEACGGCRALHADLIAIASATRADPPAVLPRTADFRLTDGDVARLANPLGRLRAWLAGPRGAITTPLAAGLATLGIAAILVSGVPFATTTSDDGGAPAAAPEAQPLASPAAGAQASSDVVGAAGRVEDENDAAAESSAHPFWAASPGTIAAPSLEVKGASPELGDDGTTQSREGTTALAADATGGPSPMLVLGIVLVGAAVVIVSLRPVARRLR
jgi:hypothetical protein